MTSWMGVTGRALLVLAAVLFLWGFTVFMSGTEVAFLGILAALPFFTLGIGMLAAARRFS